MAEWKKIVLSGADAVLNDVVVNSITGSMTGSFKGDGSGLTGVASSLGIAGSTGTGTVNLTTQTLTIAGTANEIEASAANQTVTIGLPSAVTLTTSLTVPTASIGELVVTGTSTVLNTSNLTVEDRFVLLASGSTSATDAGIIVAVGATGGKQTGKAFFYDSTEDRWSFNDSLAEDSTGGTPQGWVSVAYHAPVAGAPVTAPRWGGSTYGHGSFFVDTNTGDVYVYTTSGVTVAGASQTEWGVSVESQA